MSLVLFPLERTDHTIDYIIEDASNTGSFTPISDTDSPPFSVETNDYGPPQITARKIEAKIPSTYLSIVSEFVTPIGVYDSTIDMSGMNTPPCHTYLTSYPMVEGQQKCD